MERVLEFADRSRSLKDLAAFDTVFATAVCDLGFSHHALVEHVDLARPPGTFLFVHNYPDHWVEAFTRRALHRLDPVQLIASRHVGGFGWDEIAGLITLEPRQAAMLVESRRNGLGEGFTVPLHAPGVRKASCSFVMPLGKTLPRTALFAAECLAHVAFKSARQLLHAEPAHARLTPRQRQCVSLVAQGKTDWETAKILGLSEETVGKYLDAARIRFGVVRRTQLVVAALAVGEITLEDIVNEANR